MNEAPLAFAFHSDRFLFLYRKPAPPFCHPIPIQIPPREKNKNGEGAKGEGGTPRLCEALGGMVRVTTQSERTL